jgi:hypothetical protein
MPTLGAGIHAFETGAKAWMARTLRVFELEPA